MFRLIDFLLFIKPRLYNVMSASIKDSLEIESGLDRSSLAGGLPDVR